jgi:hypothetical protein
MTDPPSSEISTIGGWHQVPNVEGEGSKPLATAVLAMRTYVPPWSRAASLVLVETSKRMVQPVSAGSLPEDAPDRRLRPLP